ncbi:MAG: hypothetical protein JST82_08120 [Bacteroidetes bacterium]|nr:hypothetical protein [Bacteroidota bacterium]
MKKIVLVSVLALFGVLNTQAQVNVHVNIGLQPLWGSVGYDYVRYYYIPDCDAYYDVPNRVYIFMDGGRWVHSAYLPGAYRNIDMYRVHKVVINERDPWMHHRMYHDRYIGYRGSYDQVIIRDSRERKYWQNPGHPHYNEWRGGGDDRGNPGRGNGWNNGGDRGNHGGGRGHDGDHGGGHGNGHGNGHRR